MITSEIIQEIKRTLKERWDILAAFFIGVSIVLFSFRKKNDPERITSERHKKEVEHLNLEKEAREEIEQTHQKNIEEFLEKDKKIEENYQNRIDEIEESKKDRIDELVNSDNPKQTIADALNKILSK